MKVKHKKKTDVCKLIESKLNNYFDLNTVPFDINQYKEEKESCVQNLRKILCKRKIDNISDEQINKIIIKYLKVKFNFTLNPTFIKSNAKKLFLYLEKIIDSSKEEFEKRIRQEAIHFAKILFDEFLELKHKIENTEIKADESKYSTEVQNETMEKIEDDYKTYKNKIEKYTSNSLKEIKSEIEKLKEKTKSSKFEEEMKKTVKKVNEVVQTLQSKTTTKREEFQKIIKELIEKLKKDLNLSSLDLVKENLEFDKMIKNYKKKIEQYNVNSRFTYYDYSYYDYDDGFFTRIFTPWGTIKNIFHDYQGDRRTACNEYEEKMEEKIKDLKETINKDLLKKKNGFIDDIEKIFQSCNDKLSGLKNNKNEFDSLFRELKENLNKSFAQE